MKAEHINPFLKGLSLVFSPLCQSEPNIGKISMLKTPYSITNASVIIGVTGKIKGQVTIEFLDNSACNAASVILGGYEVSSLDELAKSAIGELGNMILGNAATELSLINMLIDITPPTVIIGSKVEITHRMPTIFIPISIEKIGALGIHISVIEAA